ncbi:TonB-dependent receptor [Sphingomonas sp. Root710]|uniref:TonB-dependent siderophore receptor n=1 Tax=Sphingomonas sp. Root710 TaxID=1736594 RepID=UPI0006F9CF6A|nr:TonB-dependent siderophore receptor [Sphingomonas sp. Root710]KRB85586.1 TonB-dependent receptor [Sphingomonas sp. Root710]
MKTSIIALVAALSAATPAAVSAEERESRDDSEIVVTAQYAQDESSSASKTGQPILLTPQSVQVVTRQVLLDQNAITLTDAVRNVAGVSSDFGFGGATSPLLVLRGFSTVSMTTQSSLYSSGTYYLDGAKVRGLPLDMANVEAVEVVKGPDSVLFGRAEPGGLVNIRSRPLVATPTRAFEQTVGEYGLSRTSARVGGALDNDQHWLAAISGSYLNAGSNREYVVEKLGTVNGSLAWAPTDGTRVALTVSYVNHRYRNDYGIPSDGDRPANVSLKTAYNDAPVLSKDETQLYRLDITQALGSDWQVKLRGIHMRSDTREVDVAPFRIDLTTGEDVFASSRQLARYYFNVRPDGRFRVDQASADLVGEIRTGTLVHKLAVGAEYFRESKVGLSYFQQVSTVSADNPVLGGTPPLDPSTAAPVDIVDRDRWYSISGEDNIDLGGGVHAVLAVRQDWTSTIYSSPGLAPNRLSFTSPRVGAVWEVARGHVLYGQFQRGLAANNGVNPDGTKLDPEVGRQYEIGYKFQSDDKRFTATLAAFDLVKTNRGDFTFFPVIQTIGKARSRGVELDFSGDITPELSLIGSYAYTKTKVDGGPLRLANVPKNAASLWARYQITAKGTIGGGAYYQSARFGDVGNGITLPAYVRFDADASYGFRLAGANMTAQINLKNVFDKRYFISQHQFSPDWIQPGAPRTLTGTLRVEL